MPRTPLNDVLMTHEFHLIDVDLSISVPPFVFIPTVGFTSITMPEVSIETEQVVEGTSDYVYNVLKNASANTITLTKGASAYNSDFWRWTMACLKGNAPDKFSVVPTKLPSIPGRRRNFMLIHFMNISSEGVLDALKTGGPIDKIKAGAMLPAAGLSAAILALSGEVVAVPAKLFMLFGCLPTRYKPGSDFDASETAVSIEELDLSYSYFEEFAITA